MIYPWNKVAWEELARLRRSLPHAVLIQGRQGIGTAELAGEFARALLCESPPASGMPCGRCPGCSWSSQGNHPDFRLIQPESMAPEADADETPRKEKRSEQIRIEQVRALQGFLAIGTHRAGLRVILIHPAETMNPNAQNALLKNLEEPPPGTVFLLIVARPELLLPTLRSRCVKITVPAPDHDTALAWMKEQGIKDAPSLLAAAGGAPLAAMDLAESDSDRQRFLATVGDPRFSPIALADQVQRLPAQDVVTWLQRWSYDLLLYRVDGAVRYHPHYDKVIRGISCNCRASDLSAYLRMLAQARGLAQHPLNPKLFFEDLFFRYRELIAGSRPSP